MPNDLLRAQINKTIENLRAQVNDQLDRWEAAREPSAFRGVELEVAAAARSAADGITEAILRSAVQDEDFRNDATSAARKSGKYRGGESRPVTITLLGGRRVTVSTPYLKPNRRGRRGRPRGVGRRGKGGSGLFPVLAALGIWFGVTPALATEVCRQVADSDSLRAGREALARRGADLGQKRVHRIVNATSQRAVRQREQWLQEARSGGGPVQDSLAGKRVVVATDGGRVRERQPRGRGRPRNNGHRGYGTNWREPKLLVVYTIDDAGEVQEEFRPVYDGTLGNCNALFSMLAGYLKAMRVQDAREVVIVGDGAKWIWERTAKLMEDVDVHADRLTEVIDWYHAVEVLHEIAALPAGWSTAQRQRWIGRARRQLASGNIDNVVAMIDDLAVGRRAKKVGKHRDYFVRNAARMQYSEFKKAKIPRGSGAVESAVRRIVNMRMKSNGTFWLEANAEGMLMLRSYLKAGRFDDLMTWSLREAASWWVPQTVSVGQFSRRAA